MNVTGTKTTGAVAASGRLPDDVVNATERVIALLRAPGADGDTPVDGTSWSVGETAAHLDTLWGRVLRDGRRSATARETGRLNAICLDEYTQRDLGVIADDLAADLAAGVAALTALPLDLEVPFHAGGTITIEGGLAVLVLEHVIHGIDIARALGLDLRVDDDAVGRALRAVGDPVSGWLRADAPDTEMTIELTDGGAPLRLRIDSGRLSWPNALSSDAVSSVPHSPLGVALAWFRGIATGDPVIDRLRDLFEPI